MPIAALVVEHGGCCATSSLNFHKTETLCALIKADGSLKAQKHEGARFYAYEGTNEHHEPMLSIVWIV